MNTIFLKLLVALVIGIGLGYGLSYVVPMSKPAPAVGLSQTACPTMPAVQERLRNAGYIGIADSGREVKALSGTIEQMSADSFRLKIITIDPLAAPELDRRQVMINANTVIMRTEKKDDGAYQLELKSYEDQPESERVGADPSALPPRAYEERPILAGQLVIGDAVFVEANDNIIAAPSFTAAKVTVQYKGN